MTIFDLKMMEKSGLDFFYFEIERTPSEIKTHPNSCQNPLMNYLDVRLDDDLDSRRCQKT